MNIDTTKPVMITGATGYVAGWITKRLLEEGLTVHAPVRSPDDATKVAHLQAIAESTPGTIKFFKADLIEMGSYEEAMKGCEVVFHTASPFKIKVDDPQKDLVDPALAGTRNVLISVNKTPSVKRVVLTSSVVAMYSDSKEAENLPNNTIDESQWNDSANLKHNPYGFSKTLAEKEAWNIVKEQKRWDLVVINPSFVMGPGVKISTSSESFNTLKQMGDGTMKSGVPDWNIGVVDVRDLAEAQLKAAFTPSAKGRHIISGHNASFAKMAEILRNNFDDGYPFPKRTLPKWLLWLIAPMAGLTRKTVSRNVGYPLKLDNTKSKEKLNMEYRPLKETITDFFRQMVDHGVVKPA